MAEKTTIKAEIKENGEVQAVASEPAKKETKAKKSKKEEKLVISVNVTDERLEYLKTKGNMAEVKELLEEIVKAQNAWLREEMFKESNEWNVHCDALVNRYTNQARNKAFDECKSAEDPMIHAMWLSTFDTLRVKETADPKTKEITRSIEDITKDIDLIALNKYVEGGIGANKNWEHYLQKLNFLLAIKVGEKIDDPKWSDKDKLKEISSSFAMSEIARDFEMGKNPVSNTQMLKTLTSMVQYMVGDSYKATSHDVAWLEQGYARKDRKRRTLQLPNHKTFTMLMSNVCEHIVTGRPYEADSKCVKKS